MTFEVLVGIQLGLGLKCSKPT